MTYVCKELQTVKVPTDTGIIHLQTCVSWVEQVTINDMFGISVVDAFNIGLACCLVIIVSAVFNKLSRIGDNHD